MTPEERHERRRAAGRKAIETLKARGSVPFGWIDPAKRGTAGMTPEKRSEVGRLGGLASQAARRRERQTDPGRGGDVACADSTGAVGDDTDEMKAPRPGASSSADEPPSRETCEGPALHQTPAPPVAPLALHGRTARGVPVLSGGAGDSP